MMRKQVKKLDKNHLEMIHLDTCVRAQHCLQIILKHAIKHELGGAARYAREINAFAWGT
jgi:hypothetical protein